MAERRVRVRFEAEISGFRRAMDEAAAATRRTSQAAEQSSQAADTYLGRMVQSANESRDAWDTAGASLLGIGTAAVGGLGLAGKAAMDWESAWAGVTKTVDGTPAQMDGLEASLRGLAKTLPATHEEIAGVAEAAGQLGVKREDVVGFTETMIALGETTNLTADEAATSIAQISNVMGTMEREGSEGVERFSATLVALGNAGASTEAEIVDMAQRIAGAGKLVGASESDVLALANAMASVGIESQLGGGVISRVMQRMYADVKTGGEGLEGLAKVAGVSSKDFAAAFETDPVRAVDMMVKGLARVKDEGGNVVETMSNLGIKGTEETSVLLRLAGAGDLLADSLKLGDEAWASNSALAEEAAKRYETTESKVKVAWNNIKDAAIDAGAVLLPIIAGAAESVAGMAQAFGSLPEPVKGALSVLGGVAGVAALGAGAFLTLTPKILDSMQAFDRLAPAGSRARGVLAGVGKAAGAAGAIATVALIFAKLAESDYMSKIDTGMGKVSLALTNIATNSPDAASSLDQVFKDRDGGDLISSVTDLDSALKRTFKKDAAQSFNDGMESFFNTLTGIEGSSQILEGSFDRLDAGLADLVSGGKAEDAAKSFGEIKKAAEDQGVSVEDLATKFPQYADALKAAEAASKTAAAEGKNLDGSLTDAGAAAEAAAGQAEEIEKALEDVGLAADGTVTDLAKFAEALVNAGLMELSARDAARNFEAAIDAVSESVATNGQTLDTNTEQGRANEATLDAIAAAGFSVVKSNAANGESQKTLQGNLKGTYDGLVAAGKQFGLTDEQAIALARDILKVPPKVDVNSWMSSEAKRMAEQTKGALDAIPPVKNVTVNTTYNETTIQKVIRELSGDAAPVGAGTVLAPKKKAFGGPIFGPGTGTSDDIPAMLSNGEHVLTAAEVAKMGGHAAVERMRAMAKAGLLPRFAGGGAVARREAWIDYQKDARRGGGYRSVAESASSANSFADRLTSLADSGNVGAAAIRNLYSAAGKGEAGLRTLHARSDRLSSSLEKAKGKLEDLAQVRDGVKGDLSGGFTIGDAVKRGNMYGTATVSGIQGEASGYLSRVQAFAGKLKALQKMGYSGAIVQEIAEMGLFEGARAADVLLKGTKPEVQALNKTKTAIGSASTAAGNAVTDALYKGGIKAADAFVARLTAQQGAIEKQMLRIGVGMENALRSALGVKPRSTGGILRGYSAGGQLPSTGPGTEVTDGFLGIDMAGRPVARLDKDEWIINGRSSDRYNRELAAINAGTFPKLPGYADGARHGREYSAQQLGYAPYAAGDQPRGGGMNIAKVEINHQRDPGATFMEFSRRARQLST